jgi:hypothetical protein
MRIKIACAVGLLAALTACTGTTENSQPTSTPAAPTSQSASEEAPAPAGGACPVGDYEVTSISGKGGTQVNGIPITVSSAGALKLELTEGGTWQLSGDGATVTLQASGVSAEATVDGTAEGVYSKVGEDYAFRQEKATGKVTLKEPIAGTSSLPMADVGPALAPAGTAKLTCGDGTLTIASESVTLELRRVGGGGASTPPSTGSGGGASGGPTLTLNDSAQTKTVDCAGRNVSLNGSANKLTFTGSCGAISVNGSRNEITLEKVGQISVNGSANKITWASGDPKVSNNGTGNTISQG